MSLWPRPLKPNLTLMAENRLDGWILLTTSPRYWTKPSWAISSKTKRDPNHIHLGSREVSEKTGIRWSEPSRLKFEVFRCSRRESSVSKREGKRNVHEHLQETEKHGEVQGAFLYKEFGTRPGLHPFLVLMFEQRSSFLFSAADLSWHRSSASDEATLDSMMNEAPSGTCLSS